MNLSQKIQYIAKEKNAIILAHNYQPAEIQEIADFTGDSLELSRIAADNKADLIVFCGVYFMAESAYILSRGKKIILPELNAGCPMADMASADKIIEMKKQHPGAKVVCYINSTAEAKAVSDVCCTSSNAVKIIQNIDSEKIIFIPDKNLGSYVAEFTDKKIILWDGYCPVHNNRTMNEILAAKEQNSDAEIIMHPECPPEIRKTADKILSTGEMVAYCKKSKNKKFIVATENGMIYKLKKEAPQNTYIELTPSFICEDMKKISLEKLYASIVDEKPIIKVDALVAENARGCLDAMLTMS